MLSTIKPIIVKVDNIPAEHLNSYISYTIALEYNTNASGGIGEKPIYTGKTFVDSAGASEVHLERVLRDYLYRWTYAFNEASQIYQPTALKGSFSQFMDAVEYTDDMFFNTSVKVTFSYGEESQEKRLNVCGAWVPAYQTIGDICGSLETSAITAYVQNYALAGTNIPPHIPSTATSNYWLGMVLNINQAAPANIGSLSLGTSPANTVPINYTYGGTYAAAWTINTILEELADNTIDGGTAPASLFDGTIDGGEADATYEADIYDGGTADSRQYTTVASLAGAKLRLYWTEGSQLHSSIAAIVDECPKQYYIAWITPTGGWTSYGFDGNETTDILRGATMITNILGERETLEVSDRESFSLYSDMVNAETYGHLLTIIHSPVVYLYDARRDRGFYCNVATNRGTTMPSKTGKLQYFNIQLESISDNIR